MGTQKGYSWKTNQYGLTIDTVESFKLVLPDGTFQIVTSLNEDLWFGLRVCYTILDFRITCSNLTSGWLQ
jgi:hypothetical protein